MTTGQRTAQSRARKRPLAEQRYLGFTLQFTDHGPVRITQGGRPVGSAPSIRAARLFVRGWRREERQPHAAV